jgi:cytochrome c peroxidase
MIRPIERYRELHICNAIHWSMAAGLLMLSFLSGPAFSDKRLQEPITPIPESVKLPLNKVKLGEKLFNDTRLSRDNSISCASCHDLKLGGADGLPFAIGIDNQAGGINTPTVLNSGYNFRQFWDGRAGSLEEQVPGPVHNPIEMDSNWTQVLAKLSLIPYYREQFVLIYPNGLTAGNIIDAIATYERSLITPNAPFDRYLRGERSAINADTREGYTLFKSYGCIACHQGINVGGNLYQRFGIFGNPFTDSGEVQKEDLGRYNITGKAEDRYTFKVPGLRNVEKTAPYFHDGSATTLEEAVQAMAHYQLGTELGEDEIGKLVLFLKSLTGQDPPGVSQ